MHASIVIQGRLLADSDLRQIGDLLTAHPAWHRTRLSRERCELWGWRNEAGRLKDMACRTLLLKLESRGLVELPPRRKAPVNAHRNLRPKVPFLDTKALDAPPATLTPLAMEAVAPGTADAELFAPLLAHHHYLGHRNGVGENLRYLVRERGGRPATS